MAAKKRKRKARKGLIVFLVVILLICAGGAGAVFWYQSALTPVGQAEEAETITIAEGESRDVLFKDLAEKKLIKSELAASVYSKLNPTTYYPGNYRLNKGMSVPEIMTYLSDEKNQDKGYAVITIPEGYWAKQIAAVLAHNFPQYTEKEFLDLWNDPNYIQTLSQTYDFIDPAKLDDERFFVKLEGYLFPDTYFMEYDMTPDQITRMFLDQFGQVYNSLKPQIEASGMSLEEILTFASIVQFECGNPAEMANIAGVFANRMEKGMKLQSSVTVCYALYDDFKSAADCETNPEIDSPYNTYMHEGLPSGPILNPGKEAIEAVLNPAKHDYLYFISDIHGDGTIHYAKTYEEHEQNVEKYNLKIE